MHVTYSQKKKLSILIKLQKIWNLYLNKLGEHKLYKTILSQIFTVITQTLRKDWPFSTGMK